MREFSFDDGNPTIARSVLYDNFRGRNTGWTRDDFIRAVNTHCKAFGPEETQALFMRLFGTSVLGQIPAYAHGRIIAAVAEDMIKRQSTRILKSPQPYYNPKQITRRGQEPA